ncbi:hypothetical protein XM25_19767 [Devosia sp. H5989]|nr:hypothetical protein XM25_19767 [Devosia sp. H5989]
MQRAQLLRARRLLRRNARRLRKLELRDGDAQAFLGASDAKGIAQRYRNYARYAELVGSLVFHVGQYECRRLGLSMSDDAPAGRDGGPISRAGRAVFALPLYRGLRDYVVDPEPLWWRVRLQLHRWCCAANAMLFGIGGRGA